MRQSMRSTYVHLATCKQVGACGHPRGNVPEPPETNALKNAPPRVYRSQSPVITLVIGFVGPCQVMKSIIAFYSKAKAHVQLSDFYDACAQVR